MILGDTRGLARHGMPCRLPAKFSAAGEQLNAVTSNKGGKVMLNATVFSLLSECNEMLRENAESEVGVYCDRLRSFPDGRHAGPTQVETIDRRQ